MEISATGTEIMAKKAEHETVRTKPRFPHEDSAIAKFLTKHIEGISYKKSQREIASEAGYDKPNILSMFKRGETKVPLDKIPALAKALEVDPAHLFRLALEQQMPELSKVITQVLGKTVTDNEYKLVQAFRQATQNADPKPTAAQLRAVKDAFGSE